MQIPISDHIGQNLASFFPQAIEFIGELNKTYTFYFLSGRFTIGTRLGIFLFSGPVRVLSKMGKYVVHIAYTPLYIYIVPQVFVTVS